MKFFIYLSLYFIAINLSAQNQQGSSNGVPNSIKQFVEFETNYLSSKGQNNGLGLTVALLKAADNRFSQLVIDANIIDSHFTHLSNRLHILGFNPGNITSLSNQGIDVVDAALAGSNATITQQAILSEYVYEITIESIVNEDLEDGYLSTVLGIINNRLKQKRNMKQVKIRLESGKTNDGKIVSAEDEWNPKVGEKYIVFVSEELYSFYSELRNYKPNQKERYTLLQWNPLRIIGNFVQPILPSVVEEGTQYKEIINKINLGIK